MTVLNNTNEFENGYFVANTNLDESQYIVEVSTGNLKNLELSKENIIAAFNSILKSAQSTKDFINVAEAINEILNDKEWSKNLYHKAQIKVKNFDDIIDLANSISKNLKDSIWSKRLYRKSLTYLLQPIDSSVIKNFISLSEAVYKELKNRKWAAELYLIAENYSTTFVDYIMLANSIVRTLQDKRKATDLFVKAYLKADEKNNYFLLFNYLVKLDEFEKMINFKSDGRWITEIIFTDSKFGKIIIKTAENDSNNITKKKKLYCILAKSLKEITKEDEWKRLKENI